MYTHTHKDKKRKQLWKVCVDSKQSSVPVWPHRDWEGWQHSGAWQRASLLSPSPASHSSPPAPRIRRDGDSRPGTPRLSCCSPWHTDAHTVGKRTAPVTVETRTCTQEVLYLIPHRRQIFKFKSILFGWSVHVCYGLGDSFLWPKQCLPHYKSSKKGVGLLFCKPTINFNDWARTSTTARGMNLSRYVQLINFIIIMNINASGLHSQPRT